MKYILILLLLNSIVAYCQGQIGDKCLSEIDTLINQEVYKVTDKQAKVDGGMNAVFKEVAKRIKYPEKLRRYSIDSKVFVAFIIEEDGSVIGQRVIKNIDGTDFGEQLLKIVGEFKWQPAICNGNPVKSILILPMIIHLD